MRRTGSRSVMTASTRSRPWHFGHSRTSTEKLRRSRRRPVHARLDGVEHAPEQPIPVLHRDHVRRELDDVAASGGGGGPRSSRGRRSVHASVRRAAFGRATRAGVRELVASWRRWRSPCFGLVCGWRWLLGARRGARSASLARLGYDLAAPGAARCQHPREPRQRVPWGASDRRQPGDKLHARHHAVLAAPRGRRT